MSARDTGNHILDMAGGKGGAKRLPRRKPPRRPGPQPRPKPAKPPIHHDKSPPAPAPKLPDVFEQEEEGGTSGF